MIETQINEIKRKIERLELRFAEGEITKELFEKYSNGYTAQATELKEKLKVVSVNSSNLEKMILAGLEIAENISVLWKGSDFNDQKKLQQMVFPEGILYNK